MRICAALGIAGTLAFSSVAEAAPVVGAPFFLARTERPTEHSITASADSLMLAYSWSGNTYAQRLDKDARIMVGPQWLGGNVLFAGQFIGSPATRNARVVSNGSDFLVWWERQIAGMGIPWPSAPWFAVGAILSSSGSPTPVVLGPEAASTLLHRSSEVAPAASGWAVMTRMHEAESEPTLSVDSLDPGGLLTRRYVLPNGFPTALAASGDSILAAWGDADGHHLGLVGDTTVVLTEPNLPSVLYYGVLLRWDGSAYLAVWKTSEGDLEAARVMTDGTVDPIVLGPDGGAPASVAITLLDVETAGGTSLVLYEEANGDGGTLVRGIRIDAAGTVLDPGGFDVAPGSSGDVAAVRSGLWLVATAESLDGKDLIRGRFVGDTTVPPPPSNVELPVVYPDDALTDAEAGTRDAGKPNAGGEVPGLADAASDTAIDGAAPPAVDASDVELSEPVGTNLSGGCSCRVGRGERAVPLTWFAVTALVIGAMGRRRDQPGR